MQHVISPLLSVPHAAAAFGLAFLIAPVRLSHADRLAVADGHRPATGLADRGRSQRVGDDRRAGREGSAVSVARHAGGPAPDRRRTGHADRPLARLWTHGGVRLRDLAAGLSANPPRRLRGHRLRDFSRGRGNDPRPEPAVHSGRAADPVDVRRRYGAALHRVRRGAGAAGHDRHGDWSVDCGRTGRPPDRTAPTA